LHQQKQVGLGGDTQTTRPDPWSLVCAR